MRRAIAATVAAVLLGVGAVVVASAPDPTTPQEWCRVVDVSSGDEVTVPCYFDLPPTTTVPPPTTTVPPPTTTVPTPTPGFMETFDGNTGLDRFDLWVFHRNLDVWGFNLHGGKWTGDHDQDCGSPATQRPLSAFVGQTQAQRQVQSVYVCRDHMMTSMGDVDGYSIVTFSPKQVFDSVRSVSFDVNLTDLGTRQWWKVGVLSESMYNSQQQWNGVKPVPGFLVADVFAADITSEMQGPEHLVATWSGGASAGYPGGMKIGDTKVGAVNPSPLDKVTRHPVSLVDNGDGTVTFTVAGVSHTAAGSFPPCPCRVVFYDQNYTPDKSESGPGTQYGYSWHWDNIVVD